MVAAPSRKRERAKLLEDTTGAEARDLFRISTKIGRRLSGLMLVLGASLSFFSVYSILTSAQFSFSAPLFIGALVFLGAVNIFCGLILLAKE